MAFLRAQRVLYIHPTSEAELDEGVLRHKGRRGRPVPSTLPDVAGLRGWLQEELPFVDSVLVPGDGWYNPEYLPDGPLPVSFALHVRGSEGKRRRDENTAVTVARSQTKRVKDYQVYEPMLVKPDILLGGRSSTMLVALKWLALLEREAAKVDLTSLRELRLAKVKPKESAYYPGILAFLRAASIGQKGLNFGGQGYGNLKRADLQGFICGKPRALSEVKTKVFYATDKDETGMVANATLIKQEADYLKTGIEGTDETTRLGCLFCRMDRFWIVKYLRETDKVQVTPGFPFGQKPDESPLQLAGFSPDFVLMKLSWLNEISLESISLKDVLPPKPMPGFCTLVSYTEELQRMYDLPVLNVRFVGPSTDIPLSDLTPVAYGKKSLVVLRRSASNVLKICSPSSAEMERRIHGASDGHSNVRRLVNWGLVSIGETNDVFGFLELEGYGQPFGREHIADMEAMDDMWNQAYCGLKHLHSKGVLHRDVKPDNLVVFSGNVLKINDYDVSCFKGESRAYSEMVGTVGYQSPSDMLPYVEEDDVLSLALSFYALKFGTTTTSKAGRLHILLRELQPDVFPETMIQAVKEAVTQLDLELLEED
ncbi:uncharacterized protein LOC9657880 [Selaginella moellendorffii]|uniref:uncharacterized protein LOC9657880 n=1 Tax=Selaginella moellendorffii TaxID=88036 RepID=UPI000D1C295B|nr:uncharacterized protein LOC9657880 [Selaginella moellendorffii]|eukprot:XP_024535291.1 uncharacterized protein LOC9657880 [Selaginella moellendorffii]